MARVTIEDCLKNVENRFDLVLKAAERARNLELGSADATVPIDNDKPTVVALREIAAGNDLTAHKIDEVPEDIQLLGGEDEVVEVDFTESDGSLDDELRSEFADAFKLFDQASSMSSDDADADESPKIKLDENVEIRLTPPEEDEKK